MQIATLHPPGSPFALMMPICFTTREELVRGCLRKYFSHFKEKVSLYNLNFHVLFCCLKISTTKELVSCSPLLLLWALVEDTQLIPGSLLSNPGQAAGRSVFFGGLFSSNNVALHRMLHWIFGMATLVYYTEMSGIQCQSRRKSCNCKY